MSRLNTAFVLGFHGCDAAIARKAIDGEIDLLHSDENYDWLGPGAYFWERDPQRALEWAEGKVRQGDFAEAAVIGAVIDLRNCLDLTNRKDIKILQLAHQSFIETQQKGDLPIPVNKSAPGGADQDRSLRFLDCAVFRHLHSMMQRRGFDSFDTVRGTFPEGGEAYEGAGFQQYTHTQIAVRNNECILGIFWPREHDSLE